MTALPKALANARTTLARVLFATLVQWQATGCTWPQTRQEWTTTLVSLAILVLGCLAKDGATGSRPGQEV